MREAEKGERFRFSFSTFGAVRFGEPTKLDEPGFLAMKLQSKLRQPFLELRQELLGFLLVLKSHDKVSKARGVSPRASRRTVLERLRSYGSRHGTSPHAHSPMGKHLRSAP